MFNNRVKIIRNKNLGTDYLSLKIVIFLPRDFRALFKSHKEGLEFQVLYLMMDRCFNVCNFAITGLTERVTKCQHTDA